MPMMAYSWVMRCVFYGSLQSIHLYIFAVAWRRGGVAGTDGTDGTDGTAGMAGTDGTDGMAGMAGMAGTAGMDCMDGMDGTDGGKSAGAVRVLFGAAVVVRGMVWLVRFRGGKRDCGLRVACCVLRVARL